MKNSSIYDISKTFEENVTYGPFWEGKLPRLPKRKPKHNFFGHSLNSCFGIPACPLTGNARFIELVSLLGYDLLTYKSVRSIEWHGNRFPHWVYVKTPDISSKPKFYEAAYSRMNDMDVSMANSFGVHSLKPEYWQEDVNQALALLQKGQLMILSLMPTPRKRMSLVDDAKVLAKYAAQTKAGIFEVNFACPNTDGGKGLIYEDIDLTVKISRAMKKILGDKPLLAKVGYYTDQMLLRDYMKRTKGVINGISSMNTISGKVIDKKSKKDFFPGRPTAGVSGAVIRNIAMEQTRNVVNFRTELGLKDFVVIGIGGVTKPEHIKEYLDIGVDAVQSAVGAWADPLLAYKYLQTL